jgi:hypothetical protein
MAKKMEQYRASVSPGNFRADLKKDGFTVKNSKKVAHRIKTGSLLLNKDTSN